MDPTAAFHKHLKRIPNQERSQRTVLDILEGAAQVLIDEGFENLTTGRIAERAGVSVGSLYQYFECRDAIVSALVADQIAGVMKRIRERITDSPPESFRDTVAPVIDALLEQYREAPERFSALIENVTRMGSQHIIQELDLDMEAWLAALLVESGLAPANLALLRARLVVTSVDGMLAFTLRFHPADILRPEFRAEMIRLVDRIIWDDTPRA